MLFVTLFMILFFHMDAIFKKKAQTGMVADDGKTAVREQPYTRYTLSIWHNIYRHKRHIWHKSRHKSWHMTGKKGEKSLAEPFFMCKFAV